MAKRRSIDIPDLPMHKNPFPTVVRIKDMIFSSAISGMGRGDAGLPEDAMDQIRNAFKNMKDLVEDAGGTTDDIAAVKVFLADIDMRPMVNEEWVKMFPDAHDRPVRHTIAGPLQSTYVIQMEFTAVV